MCLLVGVGERGRGCGCGELEMRKMNAATFALPLSANGNIRAHRQFAVCHFTLRFATYLNSSVALSGGALISSSPPPSGGDWIYTVHKQQ